MPQHPLLQMGRSVQLEPGDPSVSAVSFDSDVNGPLGSPRPWSLDDPQGRQACEGGWLVKQRRRPGPLQERRSSGVVKKDTVTEPHQLSAPDQSRQLVRADARGLGLPATHDTGLLHEQGLQRRVHRATFTRPGRRCQCGPQTCG